MSVFIFLLMAVEIIVSVLLIGIILIQKTKNQGMGLAFGSAMGESLFGAQAGNVLTKATIILSIVFLANTMLLGLVVSASRGGSVTSKVPVVTAPVQLPETAPGMQSGGPGVADTAPGAMAPMAPPVEQPAGQGDASTPAQ